MLGGGRRWRRGVSEIGRAFLSLSLLFLTPGVLLRRHLRVPDFAIYSNSF